jgi:hypothetical protein
MNRKWRILTLVLTGLVLIVALSGCSDDDDSSALPANIGFNGTFTGTLTLTPQGGAPVQSMITVTLTVSSPLTGDFSTDNGTTGSISGDASGDSATFAATIDPPCQGDFNGTMVLSAGSLAVDATGQDCDGPFTLTADLAPQNISGSYDNTLTLVSEDNCDTGSFEMPINIFHEGGSAELFAGAISGPGVTCSMAAGTVVDGQFIGDGTVNYPDFFAKGCDLIATTAWVYTVSGKGDSVGSLDLTFGDSPEKCADFGPAFPCTSEYGVLGNLCKACGPVCPPPPVNAESLGSAWGRP